MKTKFITLIIIGIIISGSMGYVSYLMYDCMNPPSGMKGPHYSFERCWGLFLNGYLPDYQHYPPPCAGCIKNTTTVLESERPLERDIRERRIVTPHPFSYTEANTPDQIQEILDYCDAKERALREEGIDIRLTGGDITYANSTHHIDTTICEWVKKE